MFYTCCIEDECETIIFDTQEREFLTEKQVKELIDLNYIKYNLHNGNLTTVQFDLKGFDVCSYFGKKELRQESLNLGVSVAEAIDPTLNTKIKDIKKVAKVGKFNPTTFIASASCNYDNENLEPAMEALSNCNIYLDNINNNYAREGYVEHFYTEVKISEALLKNYIDSVSAQIRGVVNTVGNMFLGLIRFIINFDLQGDNDLVIEKTELEYAREAYNKVVGYDPYLKNPENEKIYSNYVLRVNQKNNQYIEARDSYALLYGSVKSVKPSFLKVFFVNFFMDPNYKISSANKYYHDAKSAKKNSDRFIEDYKFNSAIAELSGNMERLEISREIYLREANIKRHIDYWVIVILAALIVAGYALYTKYG